MRMNRLILIISMGFLTSILTPCMPIDAAEAVIDAREFMGRDGEKLLYRVFKPANYDPDVKYPLALCLHGGGGKGTDNRSRGTQAFTAVFHIVCRKGLRSIRDEEETAMTSIPKGRKERQWNSSRSTLLLIAAAVALLGAGHAHAAVWYVDIDNSSGTEDGATWARIQGWTPPCKSEFGDLRP